MSIKRSILHDNRLWHTDTERRKVPHGLDAALHHVVRYLLSNLNGHGQYPNIHIVLLHFLTEIVGMEMGMPFSFVPTSEGLTSKAATISSPK